MLMSLVRSQEGQPVFISLVGSTEGRAEHMDLDSKISGSILVIGHNTGLLLNDDMASNG